VEVGVEILDSPVKVRHVDVVYPDEARRARVQGAVILECTISPEGEVIDLEVVHGSALLHQAAIDAVRQWVFAPTLIDGVRVAVITRVTVTFALS
jgi:periplasmic protein TonB